MFIIVIFLRLLLLLLLLVLLLVFFFRILSVFCVLRVLSVLLFSLSKCWEAVQVPLVCFGVDGCLSSRIWGQGFRLEGLGIRV